MSIELPGGLGALSHRLLTHLDKAGARGLEASELGRKSGLEPTGDELDQALGRLRAAGETATWKGRWYRIAKTSRVAGRLERGDGAGGMVARLAAGGTRFVADEHLGEALAGDLVLLEPIAGRQRRVDGDQIAEASVVEVLDRPYAELVGSVEDAGDGGSPRLAPYDSKTPLKPRLVGGRRVEPGRFVVAVPEPPAEPGGEVRARVIEVLGDSADPGVDVAVVLRHYGIPDRFPAAVEAAANTLPADPDPDHFAGRIDLRGEPLVTIDGESAQDFDDALSIEELPDGGWRLGVHIADVSFYVPEGGVLDAEAFRRGTSVYYPERAVPMLPERLSAGLCSLRPGVPRLALSALLDIGPDGRVQRRRFAETVIESARRLTYEEVRRVLEDGKPRDALEYGSVLPRLEALRELMEVLLARRLERGSLDFDLPEGNVELDTDGYTVGVRPARRTVAHRIVEEMMIAANEAVASTLVEEKVDGLFRVHDAPKPRDLDDLVETLDTLGLELEADPEELTPGHLRRLLDRAAGEPFEEFVHTVVMRALKRAVYSPECRGHFALASRRYTHFTSPIRRYPDLVVHRRLKELVGGTAETSAAETLLAERLPRIAEHAGATERRAERSERDLLQWKKVRFLADRVGERFPGRITGVQPFGLFVQLDEYFVDGLVPVRTLGDDFYRFEAEHHRLVGEDRGTVFRLGDELAVRLVGVSQEHRGLDLEPARPDSGRQGRGERGGRRRGGGRGGDRGGRRRGTGRPRRGSEKR